MTASVFPAVVSAAVSEVTAAMGNPAQHRAKVINGYLYGASVPPDLSGPAHPDRSGPPQGVPQLVQDLPRRWREEFEPELVRDLARMRAMDLAALPTAGLLSHLDEALALHRRHWVIHMRTVFPVFAAGGMLAGLYAEITGSRDEAEPYTLLQGFDNKTLECDRALRDLAESARGEAPVAAALALDEAGSVRRALAGSADGTAFLGRLDAFLDRYGHRASAGDDYADPTWREDVSFVLAMVRNILASPPVDVAARQRELEREREALVAQALAKAGDGQRREAFLGVLRHAQAVWPLRETHAFYIDQASMAMVRRVLVEMGQRLAQAGCIEGAQDVFYLTLDEARRAVEAPCDLRAAVREARSRNQAWAALDPPPFVGAPPSLHAAPRDPEIIKFAGRPVPRPEAGARTLRGAGASAGVARGRARIARSPQELSRLRPGDILVCSSTTPAWTPAFGVIAGLVTDSGGVLCHGAIVAREYRIPAVVGVGYATALVRDGDRISIDGKAGTVTIG